MMSAISWGSVLEFGTDVTVLMYLVTTIQALVGAGLLVLSTDRNARLAVAEFRPVGDCGDLVDWPLMNENIWRNIDDDPVPRERRMAGCLVYQRVSFDVFKYVVMHGEQQANTVCEGLARSGVLIPVDVRAHWYI
jgi:ssDNA thymidine ADP-ribosyltransferase DarT-like protein